MTTPISAGPVLELAERDAGPATVKGSGPDGLEASLLFIGTATTLLRYGGFTLLTDPNFLHQGQRAYLGHGLVSRRRTEPALGIEQLPELDLVVLSHLHGDHFDRVARRGLRAAYGGNLPVVTTVHASRRLSPRGWQTWPLTTWNFLTVKRGAATLHVTALPGRHAPGVAQALLPPVMGTLLDFASPGWPPLRLYLTGDTLVHDDLRQIRERKPGIDVAVLHLGGTRVLGMLVTMDARQGVDLLEIVRPRAAVPIHYDDYTVFRSSLEEFRREVERRRPSAVVSYVGRGESVDLLALAAPAG